ncbi:hypothetical protein Tsubulata_007681 [Turnera subulata]|uniref:Protein kinase domain-containing protein n=1 Tax=Turnera subulata TaxID=218843 RepID=A0A9Q0FNC0_9ROSI|nr:hypothetical protein Tsubulata_007681 [Turnera subulata]
MAAVRLLHHLTSSFFFSSFIILSICNLSASLTENEALLKFKESLTHNGKLDNWDDTSSPCVKKWVGVKCFGGLITGLHLSKMGISGTINLEALQEIRSLRTISFVDNKFTGPLPAFNSLGALKALLLSGNEFSGEIASDFFASMSSLKKVWLDRNKFTGKIPESVMKLPYLRELHLEGNQFAGPIPPLNQPKLMLVSLDVSDNQLEGKITETLSTFPADAFKGNAKLCGKPLATECSATAQAATEAEEEDREAAPEDPASSGGSSKLTMGVTAVLVIGMVLLAVILLTKRRRDDSFTILEKENLPEVMPPSTHGSSAKSVATTESSKKASESSTRRGSSAHQGRNGLGELIMVNTDKGSLTLPDLMKAAAEVLGNGGLGSAYKAVLANGMAVVVKRMRELGRLSRDEFDAEMRRFGRIKHKNILTPMAYHFRKEEKLVVSQYVPKGSLLYLLHGDRGTCHQDLNWPTRLRILKGIASGMGFIHTEYESYNLPHGNLKSSNVLLDDSYEPLINDYAFDPLTNTSHASQAMFAYKSPEYLQSGEVSHKSDVYCLGIIILEVVTGKFPSQYLSNGKGGTDVVQWVQEAISEKKEQEVIDPELARNTESIDQMVKLLQIAVACVQSDPAERLDMREAIRRIEEIRV